MRISDLSIPGTEQPDPDAPSSMRGANFIYEAMRVGPEESAFHFLDTKYADRKRDLADIAEFMMFTRELWNALNQCHLGLSEKDGPKPTEKDS